MVGEGGHDILAELIEVERLEVRPRVDREEVVVARLQVEPVRRAGGEVVGIGSQQLVHRGLAT